MKIEFEDAGVLGQYDEVYGLTAISILNAKKQVVGEVQVNLGQVTSLRRLLDVLVSTLIELKHLD